uniref:Uncharacterized protein n=1 Tax=Utricularia reniformis TaxID=192314 RepID=A0A1Y0AZ05_9LAMI|nr:hypothetical protein AEK19_MT1116 [Utricularia reniformis]ART30349.1 hypothetical protein AEK19_MT1116 [Utricularia reniformis]
MRLHIALVTVSHFLVLYLELKNPFTYESINRRSLAALKAVDWCVYPVKHESLPSRTFTIRLNSRVTHLG